MTRVLIDITSEKIVVVSKSAWHGGIQSLGLGRWTATCSGGRLWKRETGVSAGSTRFTDGRGVVSVTAAAGLNQALVSQYSLVTLRDSIR